MPRTIADFRLYAAIQRQPEELDRLLSASEPVDLAADAVEAARRVFTVGIGTSWHAAVAAAQLLRAAGVDAQAWSSYDFALYPPDVGPGDAGIVFTHSGVKQFSLRSLQLLAERAVPSVLITSTEAAVDVGALPASTTILRTTEREQTAAFTVSHTTAMLLAARIADEVSRGSVGDLARVPGAVADALRLETATLELAQRWFGHRTIVALGGGPHEVSAHETTIKVAETARRAVRSHGVEQFLHGPQVQVQRDEAFLVFAGDGPALPRTREAVAFVQALGCDAAWVAPLEAPEEAEWLRVEDVGELLAPLVEVVPAQLLAGHLAALADVDGDSFRTDEPEFGAARKAIEL